MSDVVYDEIMIEQVENADADSEESGEVAVDIVKTEEKIIIIIPIAGVSRENMSVRVNDNVLIVTGKRTQPQIDKGEYIVRECFWGKFNRMIVLPSTVDTRHMHASFKNGVLQITIPLLISSVEKSIEIIEEE